MICGARLLCASMESGGRSASDFRRRNIPVSVVRDSEGELAPPLLLPEVGVVPLRGERTLPVAESTSVTTGAEACRSGDGAGVGDGTHDSNRLQVELRFE